ncbi:ABC transporter ATP-binding protein [Candidatus Methylospira mobilis]|uniref:ABC-type dipeptide transporter n=1 Tax=Candidatus Methylospira mobilis TaxID=1808979 RepID=A0A5Q0BS33_9GAMM|nr:ABC transporter ATP-binding protein [Candidatus Methylospira mobilis]
MTQQPLLTINNLGVAFRQSGEAVAAVQGLSLTINRGETFALVGESGSGKSVSALAVMRLLPRGGQVVSGSVQLNGEALFKQPEYQFNRIRGRRIGIIFQDPLSALNPVMTVGRQIGEMIDQHFSFDRAALRARTLALLEQVGLPRPEQHLRQYPHQLSGGQRQRVMIALALAGEPELLIADEPTTALDVTIQAQILTLLKKIQRQTGMALWLITHDLGIVHDIADRIAVMRCGEIVEENGCAAFFAKPTHAYSQQLLNAMPRMQSCRGRALPEKQQTLLDVQDFRVHYPVRSGIFQRTSGYVKAVDGVSFSVARGESVALVGESGCGKTTLGKALLGLIKHSGGQFSFAGQHHAAHALQIIFQDPYAAMDPRMLVGDIVAEGMRVQAPQADADTLREQIEHLLEAVGLPAASRLRYPHEFSGGQRQRICIARALAVNPALIICDEPTSALDVSVQRQILDLLKTLRSTQNLSYLFISHDLAVVAELADRILVMHRGVIVESGQAEQILFAPQHPYTRRLLASVPSLRMR